MLVYEAIEMLQGMNPLKEVTVTIGKPKKKNSYFYPREEHPDYPYTWSPHWIEPSTTNPFEVTCKKH